MVALCVSDTGRERVAYALPFPAGGVCDLDDEPGGLGVLARGPFGDADVFPEPARSERMTEPAP